MIIHFIFEGNSGLKRNSRFRYIALSVPLYQENVLIPILVLTRTVGDVSKPPKSRSRLKEVTSINAFSDV